MINEISRLLISTSIQDGPLKLTNNNPPPGKLTKNWLKPLLICAVSDEVALDVLLCTVQTIVAPSRSEDCAGYIAVRFTLTSVSPSQSNSYVDCSAENIAPTFTVDVVEVKADAIGRFCSSPTCPL